MTFTPNKNWILIPDPTKTKTESGIILDEAHTVLDWKHSFRVAYQQLLRLRALYSKMVWAMIIATEEPNLISCRWRFGSI